MARLRKIYEGKAKILYEGPQKGLLIQHFKDDATAFNGQKHATFSGKGVLNNRICSYLMVKLAEMGIPTAFVQSHNMREQIVREVEIIPLEVVIRNVSAGSFAKRFKQDEGTPLPRRLIEFYYKSDELGDPLVTEEHISAFEWATYEEMEDVISMAVRINDYLQGLFAAVDIRLIDLKLEFGRLWLEDSYMVVLADEISPDTCRLWDAKTGEKLDKDRFRQDLAPLLDGYREIAKRLRILQQEGDSTEESEAFTAPNVLQHAKTFSRNRTSRFDPKK